jgi:thiol-disulfide isomerase/thioredoxin
MQRKLRTGCWCLFVLACAASVMLAAQRDKKPSDALKQLNNQRRKQVEELLRKTDREEVQPGQSELIEEETRKAAVQRVAQFKPADWKGDELLALATLYELGEQYASRLYLKEARDLNAISRARVRLLQALVESGQLDEALKTLGEIKLDFLGDFDEGYPARITLYRDLAEALRERGRGEAALQLARAGYEFTKAPGARHPRWRDAVEPLRVNLIALIVATLEQSGKRQEADEFLQRARKGDFSEQSQWQEVLQLELATARLIGTPAPELTVARWLAGPPVKLNELRGQVVVLDFWAMWCAPCLKAFPYLREWQSAYADKGLAILGVTRFYGRSDDKEDLNREQEWQALQEFKRKHQLRYPFAVGQMDDVTNEERYRIRGLPATILIDRRGIVRAVSRGGDYRKLTQRVARLIEEKA